jgi:chromosomal replication initiator protein
MSLHSIDQQSAEEIWADSFSQMENTVDRITYETIIKNAVPTMRDPRTVEICLSKAWQRDHLQRYMQPITDIFRKKAGFEVDLLLSVSPNGEKPKAAPVEPVPAVIEAVVRDVPSCRHIDNGDPKKFLNPTYTFDNFIVGSGNRFAAAAAQAVAEAPARAYNPLFIYGGVGLGKTHLINAIGHWVLDKNPDARIVYVCAEKFVNDMIESIIEKNMKKFRGKYRNVDIFLVDDIQFIKNKESIQEEFFHTFNELHNSKSQIVITSDRPPKDIPTLEDRLRSRFEWGLIADISSPDLETRIAILKNKACRDSIEAPYEVISYIAEKIQSNIRELEGAFNRVVCYASLAGRPIEMELVQTALKDIIPDTRPKHINTRFIQDKVCQYYQIKMSELVGQCREQRFALPRQVAMFLVREIIGSSFPEIGKDFGGKHYTTIMHACNKIMESKNEPSLKNDLDNIKNIVNNSCE